MRTNSIITAILTLGFIAHQQSALSQDFQNLNFESANPSGYSPGSASLPTSAAFPGWTAYYSSANGTNAASTVGYDTISLGGAIIALEDTNINSFGPAPIQGNYSALLQGATFSGGSGNPLNAAIGQTGTIPLTAQTLTFWGSQYNGTMQVTFNSQVLSLVDISNALNYTIWGADISSYAGQTGQLLFTAVADIPLASGGLLDNIQFSSVPIPEPGVMGLLGLSGLLFTWYRRKNKGG